MVNKVPKKIYCESDGLGNIVKTHNIKWPYDEAENIEYILTDIFINSVEEFLYKKLNNGDMECSNITTFIEDFKNYIKEE